MSIIGHSLGQNQIKNDNDYSKGTYQNNRKRKLAGDNYIIVYYKVAVTYNNGFVNNVESRKNVIKEIKYKGTSYSSSQMIAIEENSSIEIHFSSSINDLSSFFRSSYDSNSHDIISIDFSHFDSSGVATMKYMFYNCQQLESINFSGFNTENLIDASSMFRGCSSLQSIDLSSFNTAKVTSMSAMFYGCSSIYQILIQLK